MPTARNKLLGAAALGALLSGAVFFTVGWFSAPGDDGDADCGSALSRSEEVQQAIWRKKIGSYVSNRISNQESLRVIQRLTEDRWETFDVREDVGRARSQLMEDHLRFLADVRKRIFTITLTKK